MPETYAQKRQRWQKLARELPRQLGERIALRNVPVVAALPAAAQTTLATALDQGLAVRQVNKAIQVLKVQPEISADALLTQLDADTGARLADTDSLVTDTVIRHATPSTDTVSRHFSDPLDTPIRVSAPAPIQSDTLSALADLLQTCFPDMVRASAEALAKSPSMEPIQHLLAASRACFDNPALRSDVTVIVLAGLLQQLTAELNHLIANHPNYQRALQTSGVNWKFQTNQK